MLSRIRNFYDNYLGIGDRLGEAFYAVWMAVVSIGLLNSVGEITPDHIVYVIGVAFTVNILWGVIDGVTVMFTNIIHRARRDQIVHDLRTGALREQTVQTALKELDGTIVSPLDKAEKESIVEALAKGPQGQDPKTLVYRTSREDWYVALGILVIDVLLVVPVVLPLVVFSDMAVAVYVSRLVAVLIFALLGASYARHLHRSPWPAALLLGGLGFGVFTLAFEMGW